MQLREVVWTESVCVSVLGRSQGGLIGSASLIAPGGLDVDGQADFVLLIKTNDGIFCECAAIIPGGDGKGREADAGGTEYQMIGDSLSGGQIFFDQAG